MLGNVCGTDASPAHTITLVDLRVALKLAVVLVRFLGVERQNLSRVSSGQPGAEQGRLGLLGIPVISGLMPINCVFNSVFWLVLCGKVGVV